MRKIIEMVQKRKAVTVAMMAVMLCLIGAGSAFASPTVDQGTVSAITSAFNDLKATALAALAAIAVIAIALFAAIYAWRYAKKVFSIIAR